MKPFLTRPAFFLLGALIGMSSGAWCQTSGTLVGHPQGLVVSPHDQDNDPGAVNLPKLELTPQLLYQLLLAEIAGARNNIPLSVGAYLDLARNTRDPRIARRAAEISLYARQPDQALEAARIWVETDGNSLQAQQMLAGLLLNAKRPDEAAVHLSKLLALDQTNPAEGLTRLGRLLARYPDKTVVVNLVEQLTAPYENIPEAQFVRAQVAANANQDARALAAIERAQALRPEWEQAVLFKAQLQQRTSSKLALETLSRFLGDFPKAREVRIAHARILVGEKRYQDARGEFARLLDENRNDPEIIYAVALLSLQLNDPDLAEKHLKNLLELGVSDPNPLRFYLGQIAENSKRPQDALQWYGGVVAGEQFLPARMRIATLLAQLGRIEEGRLSLKQAAADNPDLSSSERSALLIAEAQLLRESGRVAEAFDLLSLSLGSQPDQPELLYEAALLAEKLGKNEVLESHLRRLIKIKPDDAHAYNALGYSLADRGERLDEAQQLIEKALELAPEDPFILDSKGWLLYRRGDQSGAFDFLKKAMALRPDPEIAAHLGEVLWVMGRREDALKTWDEAAKANPANEALAATIKKFKP
ncbi:MAG: tetratricopeptide repeat protein [Sterolibacterium sp.]|nr:tetratricopeptide repeat protein [Sterolibacterium sp.]